MGRSDADFPDDPSRKASIEELVTFGGFGVFGGRQERDL
jgi:hypothetical protein